MPHDPTRSTTLLALAARAEAGGDATPPSRWATYATCPHCGWLHDTEGWSEGAGVHCDACGEPFTAEQTEEVAALKAREAGHG